MARSMERQLTPSRARERDLVLAFQAGDAAAYNHIDRECRPAAERICRRLLINPADVEEAVQETMLRAYQGLPRFNGSYALTAWVARIATNVCLDTLRARARRPQTTASIEPNMEARNGENGTGHRDPEELVEEMANADEVRQVLAELPDRHRTALVLREFEGYSHRKIAEMLDTSPARVKALIHRAKAGFRRAWKDEHPGKLAAFAPLLGPINWIRRALGRAPEFDAPASAAASATHIASVTSAPAVQSFAGIAAERMSGAMASVLLAGTVGFAVHHAPMQSRAAEQEPQPVEIVEVAAPDEQDRAILKVEEESKEQKEPRPEPSPAPAESPVPEPSPSVALAEGTIEAPDADKPDQPKPTLPPHPAGFAFSFTSDRNSSAPCGCGSASVRQDALNVSKDGFASFRGAVLNAAIKDAKGASAWSVPELQLSVLLERIDLYFEVTDSNGSSIYEGSAVQSVVKAEEWGGWTITYTGQYRRRGGPVEHADAPNQGTLSATLTFSWREQRAVVASINLDES